jgi:hypothetical protein
MNPPYDDRGHDVSQELTEVRTVLNRATSARAAIERYRNEPREVDPRYGGNEGFDPDIEDMLSALSLCIEVLQRWRKTGATKRRV